MSRAAIKRRLDAIEETAPTTASTCCLVGLPGLHFIIDWNMEHHDDDEPRPLAPCRRTGGPCCAVACEVMARLLEPIPRGPYMFEEEEL